MISVKKLGGGGDSAIKEMINKSNMLGIELIELLWIPRNRLPHLATIDVIGYKVPIVSNSTNIFDDSNPDSEWIDGTVKFYNDDEGRCWGYIYDTETNRDLLASSLANGWFRIIDKKIKEEILELAKKKGYPTEPFPTTQILTKKSKYEKDNDESIKKMQKIEQELRERLKLLEEELLRKSGEKSELINKRLRGVKVKINDTDDETKEEN